jgi:hypothetical protein
MMEERLDTSRCSVFMAGVHDGVPIALGYFVVAFTLGILAKTAGLTPSQGFVTSAVNIASAGEYAGFTVIAAQAPYLEIAVLTLVANARYFLMAAALTQRFAPETSLLHRLAVSFGVTDEIFGITVARGGALNPYYNYGAMAISVPAWAGGTSAGILAGGILPAAVVSALSVTLYGMFVWVVLPAAKRSRPIGSMVLASCALSLAATYAPVTSELSGGTRTILLTLLIAGVGAALFPIDTEQEDDHA